VTARRDSAGGEHTISHFIISISLDLPTAQARQLCRLTSQVSWNTPRPGQRSPYRVALTGQGTLKQDQKRPEESTLGQPVDRPRCLVLHSDRTDFLDAATATTATLHNTSLLIRTSARACRRAARTSNLEDHTARRARCWLHV